jgi:hypothetical protein
VPVVEGDVATGATLFASGEKAELVAWSLRRRTTWHFSAACSIRGTSDIVELVAISVTRGWITSKLD